MSSERSIPHLRDIFGINTYTNNSNCNSDSITNNTNLHNHNDLDFNKKSSSKSKKRDNNKTLTSGDVKTLERHLSMKKTIRKKIMRDLQQAFVEDPNEFRIDNTTSEQLKAEIRAEAFHFGEKPTRETDNFLDMLRGEKQTKDYSDHRVYNNNGYDTQQPLNSNNEKQSFWRRFTFKVKR